MVNIFDVSQKELVEELAKDIEKMPDFKPPEWARFVKTGRFKERPPAKDNWWYMRTASVLRNLYKKGPIGVSKLRTLYGGKKNRGVEPERFYKGSGNITRKILQQLEKAQLGRQVEKGVHKGRVITPKGRSLVDKVAQRLLKPSSRPAKSEPKAEAGAEQKEDGRARRDKEKKA
jgi:small subunit ribosomal protein S19e